jgi:glycosyltransferase involved in cell wall biosynthesis
MKKLKVLWICHFSNEKVRSKITFSNNWIETQIRILAKKPKAPHSDYANWISNGIIEFEKFEDIELHVVAPHYGMRYKTESFKINNVSYWFFRPEGDDSMLKKVYNRFFKKKEIKFIYNRGILRRTIEEINPVIVHMYGAENPYYSISALDIDKKKYPFLVSLQTLMSTPDFFAHYHISEEQFLLRSGLEKKIIESVTYIGSSVKNYREIVWNTINPNAIFTKTFLGIAEKIVCNEEKKIYDFVYFAASILKAADVAIEAFAIANKIKPSITLNIVGGETESFIKKFDERIKELGVSDSIYFSGRLSTQDDVLRQISKSKFALLPMKADIISGTIRESMLSGLPVITTITPGTPSLNEKRESVLISEQGNHEAMARSILKLLESEDYAEKIRQNALITAKERWNNSRNMKELVQAYKAIIDNHKHGTPIPAEIGATNSIL